MKIIILKPVTADFPFKAGTVKPGIHEATTNKNGAVSCLSDTGDAIGIKLDEFIFYSVVDREKWVRLVIPNIPDICPRCFQGPGDETCWNCPLLSTCPYKTKEGDG